MQLIGDCGFFWLFMIMHTLFYERAYHIVVLSFRRIKVHTITCITVSLNK